MDSQWDDVMFHLARWLVRHLDDPALILWLAQRGGQLHDRLVWLIEDKLNFARLEREGNTDELARIRAQAPNAIPRPLLRPVWRLLLTNRVKSPWRELDLYRWKDRLERDGLTATLRFELRELLAPKVAAEKAFPLGRGRHETEAPERLKQLVDWELVLAGDHVHSSLRDLADAEHWRGALPALLDDFQQLLRDALDLLRELGEADDRSDRSHWDLPSISPHWQNRGFRDWVALIELLRDAWLALRESDPARATQVAQAWFAMPYSTFKRLALFAASHDGCIASEQWVDWLVADDAWWLWSTKQARNPAPFGAARPYLTPKREPDWKRPFLPARRVRGTGTTSIRTAGDTWWIARSGCIWRSYRKRVVLSEMPLCSITVICQPQIRN